MAVTAPAADGVLAATVVAWHNRHPLAERVRPEQVLGMGIVALPVLAGGGAGRRARPAFSEQLMAPITPARAAAFAVRHGVKEQPDVSPVREVPAVAASGAAVQWMYLRTVAIEAAGRRVRVLVAAGSDGPRRPAVLGPRLWSLRRTLLAAALGGAGSATLLAGVVAALWLLPARPYAPLLAAVAPAASGPAAVSPASAASAPEVDAAESAASAPTAPASAGSAGPARPAESMTAVASPATASAVESSASAPVLAVAESASAGEPAASAPSGAPPAGQSPTAALARPPALAPTVAASAAAAPASAAAVGLADAGKTQDDVAAPADIRPRLSDEQRAEARRIGRQMRGDVEPAAAAAAAAAASAPTAADGRHYALVTRITRGRAASQVMQSLMSSAAAGAALPGQPRTEVMQVKEGFRAIWWPFASPADAEVARAALTAYGINAEVVEF